MRCRQRSGPQLGRLANGQEGRGVACLMAVNGRGGARPWVWRGLSGASGSTGKLVRCMVLRLASGRAPGRPASCR